MTIKNKLKEIREKKGLTQREISKISGVPLRTLQGLEANEKHVPKLDTCLKISKSLNLNIEDIFFIDP
jgi:DNA-binding XRE family transcriptional regulator